MNFALFIFISIAWNKASAPNKNWNSVALSSNAQYQSATVTNGYIYTSNNYGSSK